MTAGTGSILGAKAEDRPGSRSCGRASGGGRARCGAATVRGDLDAHRDDRGAVGSSAPSGAVGGRSPERSVRRCGRRGERPDMEARCRRQRIRGPCGGDHPRIHADRAARRRARHRDVHGNVRRGDDDRRQLVDRVRRARGEPAADDHAVRNHEHRLEQRRRAGSESGRVRIFGHVAIGLTDRGLAPTEYRQRALRSSVRYR
jgi:hypothetical protein